MHMYTHVENSHVLHTHCQQMYNCTTNVAPHQSYWHAVVDSRMIILDDQARQLMTRHFQLSLQCNVLPIMGFVRHMACLTKPVMGKM